MIACRIFVRTKSGDHAERIIVRLDALTRSRWAMGLPGVAAIIFRVMSFFWPGSAPALTSLFGCSAQGLRV
jgi:uncharacterized membrane protein HdeD (DUF308 family)